MNKALQNKIIVLFLSVGVLLIAYFSWKSFFQPIQDIRIALQKKIEKQFQTDIRTAQEAIQIGKQSNNNRIIGFQTDSAFHITAWSHSSFLLDSSQLVRVTEHSDTLFFIGKNIYYALSQKLKNGFGFAFIPIKIEYPIQNKIFKNFYYIGNETNLQPETIIPGDSPDALIISNGENVTFSILFSNPEIIRKDFKFYWILTITLFVLFILFLLYRYIAFLKPTYKELFLSLAIIFIRILSYYFHFPQSFYNAQLFSPEILALSNINPSLGDFSLNIFIFTWIFLRWNPFLLSLKHISFSWTPALRYLGMVILASFIYLAYVGFFSFSSLVFTNSKAFFDFTDIADIQPYSLLILIDLALLLVVFYFFTRNVLLFFWRKQKWIEISIIGLITWFSLYFFIETHHTQNIGLLLGLPVFVLSVIFIIELNGREIHNKKIIIKIIEALGLAFILNGVVAESFSLSAEARVNQLARQLETPRDPWLETLFPILRDQWTELITSGSKNPDHLLQQMVQKLNENLKLYPFSIAFFNKKEEIIASYSREIHLVPPANPLPTGITELWTQPEASSPMGWTYLAEFKHRYKIRLRIDPKPPYASSFYERLIQNNIENNIPQNFSWAIYNHHKLIVQQSTKPFPSKIDDTEIIQYQNNKDYFIKHLNQNRILLVHAPSRTLFSKLTSYSFLVYVLGILFLLFYLPSGAHYINFQSIASRIQMGFLLAALAPMLLLWLFTQPFLKQYFGNDARARLRQDLEQIAAYLTREGIFNQESEIVWQKKIGNELIQTLGQIITTDINLYNSSGTLVASTLPSVFPGTISLPLMNFHAFTQLKSQTQSHIIIEETIGNSPYFSGYIPISNENKTIIAYLHIPYLTRKDVLDTQQRSFTTYLFNLYLILLLVIVAMGFFISRSAVWPLELLREKIEKLEIGKENEKIDWHSRDEIGRLIQSYNTLIDLLSESERKLAQSEREFAWREMAKQVAHEIKNPLTPMKLHIQHLMRVTADSENGEKIEKVGKSLLTQIDTLAEIANSFSNFAKMPEGKRELIDANDLLTDVFRLYEQSEEATIHLNTSETSLFIFVIRDQLSRVLINLVKNALQVMPKHGEINLQVTQKEKYVVFSVQDNGSGIPESVQERIFEPSFSTKTSGMGLGLAMSKNIVQNHQGQIYFHSEWNKGTTFFVEIPIAE